MSVILCLEVNPLTPTIANSHMGTAVPERQSAQISKTTNDSLTRSGTGFFTAVPIWQQWASKG